MKIKDYTAYEGGPTLGYMFYCPGCKCVHKVSCHQPNEISGIRWAFNGDFVFPTFTPSILLKYPCGVPSADSVCHMTVADGRINFLQDCTHGFAGQTVEMPNFKRDDEYDI